MTDSAIRKACDIAAERIKADPADKAMLVCLAGRDMNCRLIGEEWYRMRWTGEKWEYIVRLPPLTRIEKDRHCLVNGEVFLGDILLQHQKGGGVTQILLVAALEDGSPSLFHCPHAARRDGNVAFDLPDGTEIVRPNPRSRKKT